MTGLTRRQTPEEDHLAEQERLLAELTEHLVIKETEFATTGAEFARFRATYLRRFAPLYGELDKVEAEIARLLALDEDTPAAHARAQEATERAAVSEEAARIAADAGGLVDPEEGARAVDSDLRDLYRRAAKVAHPDTASSDRERERRTRIMAAINEAYGRGDADAIQRILDGEDARPEAIEGDDIGSRLIRAVRKLAQIRARLTEIGELQAALEADNMWKLFAQCRTAWATGEDPLAEDEASVRTRIASAYAQLAALVMTSTKKRRPSGG